jgi:hypothetical protein
MCGLDSSVSLELCLWTSSIVWCLKTKKQKLSPVCSRSVYLCACVFPDLLFSVGILVLLRL